MALGAAGVGSDQKTHSNTKSCILQTCNLLHATNVKTMELNIHGSKFAQKLNQNYLGKTCSFNVNKEIIIFLIKQV